MKKYLQLLLVLFAVIPGFAATRYVSPTGNDSNLCTVSSRCLTLNRAYQLSIASDVVLVAAGSYANQTFTNNAAVTGSDSQIPDGTEVTFKPESGPGTVTLAGVSMSSFNGPSVNHLAFEDMQINDGSLASVGDVHFTRVTWRGGIFIGTNSHHGSFRDGDIGSHFDADGIDCYGCNNWLVENNRIHDISSNDPGAHPDAVATCGGACGGASSVHHFIARRNRFYRNACINYRGDGPDHDITIENNFFGDSVSYAGGINCGQNAQIHGDNSTIRYNTFIGNLQQPGTGEADGQTWTGNIITGNVGFGACPTGVGTVAQYNVWNANNPATCGGTANVRPANFSGWFVDTATGDLHLTGSASAALNAGDPTNFPSIDFDGQSRTSPPDAGADEVVSSQTAAPTNLQATVSGPTASPTNLQATVR